MTLPSNLNRFGQRARRPYYCEVEYLESSGTQYIDTGINYAGTSDVITLGIAPMQATGDVVFMGAYTLSPNSFIELGAYNGKYRGNIQPPSEIPASMTYTVGVRNTLKFTSNGWWEFNGQQCGVTKTDPVGVPFYLFGRNYESSPKYSSARIYNVDIVRSGVKILDMIPVLDWNMTPCMYDKVSNKLFYNQGTGNFTYGRQIHYVDYLESTGTQYIDTLEKDTTGYVYKTTINPLSDGAWVLWFGRQETSVGGQCEFVGYNGDNKLGASILSPGVGGTIGAQTAATNVLYNIEMSSLAGDIYFSVDGTKTTASRPGAKCNKNIYIFCINNAGTANNFVSMRLYNFKMYNSNDRLVRDYTPAIDENGVGFMFDKVEHKIYDNAGTGAFNYPPVKLEYLESTGTQYINTGFNPNNKTYIKVDFQGINTVASTVELPYGCGNYWGGKASGGNWRMYVNNTLSSTLIVTITEQSYNRKRHTVGINKNVGFFDNSTQELPSSTYQTTIPIYLFGSNNNGTFAFQANIKIFKAIIKDNEVLVRDMIPVLHNGIACMYDKVSNTYFTNAGTGMFKFKIKERK